MAHTWLIGSNYCEHQYISRICSYLQNVDLIVTDNLHFIPHNAEAVIVTSDEAYQVPDYCDKVKAVFKHYVAGGPANLYPIPLGYVSGLGDLSPLESRDTDVFFSGQIPSSKAGKEDRIAMQKALTKLNVKHDFTFTSGFRKGLSTAEYGWRMGKAKIALCPSGRIGPETFRFFEAHKLGVIPVTVKQPDNWVYSCSPAVRLSSWSELPNVITDLLKNDSLIDDVKNCWDKHYSEQAVANFILSTLGKG